MYKRQRQNKSRDSLTTSTRKIFDDDTLDTSNTPTTTPEDTLTTEDTPMTDAPPMDTEDAVQLAEEQTYTVPTFPVRSRTKIRLQNGSRVWIPVSFPDLPNAANTFWQTKASQTLQEKGFSCSAFTLQSLVDGLPAILVTYNNPGQPTFIISKGQRIGSLYAFLQ